MVVHLARARERTQIHYRKGTGHTDLLAFAAFSIVDSDSVFLPLGALPERRISIRYLRVRAEFVFKK